MVGFAATLHRLITQLANSKHPRQNVRDFAEAWSAECQCRIEELKDKLTTASVLAYADFVLPFILEVLSQEEQGKVRLIA